jgi:hypothetical protein
MNISYLLLQSWRITWRNWPLWALTLLMFIVFLPATALSGAFGAGAAVITLPISGPLPRWLIQLRNVPGWAWVLIAVAALILLVGTAAISWLFQASVMRGAAIASQRGTVSLSEALNLGWRRVFTLLGLSITFGVLIMGLSLLPPLVLLLLAERSEFGVRLMQAAQGVLLPLNTVLGIALLLIMMSVALEDLQPGAIPRRAWRVFRSGWWGFVLVWGLTFIGSFVFVLLIAPVAVILVIIAVVLSAANAPVVLGLALLLTGVTVGPIALLLLVFIAVYTLVLYTLVYQEAARLAGPEISPAG